MLDRVLGAKLSEYAPADALEQENVTATIRRIDWASAREDVQRFLPQREQEGLRFWSADFFCHLAEKMVAVEPPSPADG